MKVKIVVFLICSLSISLFSEAQNYFKEGIKWTMEITGIPDGPEFPISDTESITIKKVENTDSLAFYSWYNNDSENMRFETYVKIEGNKVFFKQKEQPYTDWYLLYDFGLSVGEGCYVYYPTLSEPGKTYVKCTGIEKDPYNENWELMKIEMYEDNYPLNYGEFVWIKGLGSPYCVFCNGHFFFGSDYSSKLLSVYDNSELIYSAAPAALNDVKRTTSPKIKVEGLILTIDSTEGGAVSIFTISGECVGQYELNGGSATISLHQPGIYILSLQDTSYTICTIK